MRDAELSVHAPPASVIHLDGAIVGEGNWTGHAAVGAHALRVTASGMQPFSASLMLHEGEKRSVDARLEPEKHGLPLALWVGGGVIAAGALGAGAYLLLHRSPTSEPPTMGSLSPGAVQLPLRPF